jgi:predicted TIM-barrel fold metal-dependent hydrolase
MPFLLARIVGRKLPLGPDGTVGLDPSDRSRGGQGNERLAQIRRFYYEVAQQTNPVALGALRRVVPASQMIFGTDYPASDSGGLAEPMADHAAGLASVFSGAELRAIEFENAHRLFPRFRA